MYLLDTVVVSELRKRNADSRVVSWIKGQPPADLYLSVLTVGEIELGIERQRQANPAFATDLEKWLDALLGAYGDRILPMTTSIARRWGKLAGQIGHKGLDLAIAATALDHGLTVVTRNAGHFLPTGVATIDPFQPRPHRKA